MVEKLSCELHFSELNFNENIVQKKKSTADVGVLVSKCYDNDHHNLYHEDLQ